MRQLRFLNLILNLIQAPSRALNVLAFSFVLLAYSHFAHATITLESVDESRVSAVKGVSSASDNEEDDDDDDDTTTIPIIYGGVAGDKDRGGCASKSSSSTCDNCSLSDSSATGDNRLLACNNRRVHQDLEMRLSVKSDSIDSGVPMITYYEDSDETEIYNGSSSVSKGSTGQISLKWSKICKYMKTEDDEDLGEDCELDSDQESASLTVRVGIDKYESGKRDESLSDSEEYMQVQFIIRNGIRTTSGSEVSVYENGDVAIYYFEIGSGDEKAYIKDKLVAADGFPSSNNINIRWVRALYEKRSDRSTPVWDQIKPDSPHADLEVSGDTTTAIDLSPRRIEGLTNGEIYDFKLAMVDAARNVGYYTSTDNNQDTDCDGDATSSESGQPECHTARPAEVVGALSSTLNCFVATASYGSPMAKEVVTFRAFRDRFLVTNAAGRSFVEAYYKYGPYAAKFIAQNETLRAAGRAVLWAPLQFVKFSLAHGFLAALALLSTIIFAPPAVWVGARRFRKSRAS